MPNMTPSEIQACFVPPSAITASPFPSSSATATATAGEGVAAFTSQVAEITASVDALVATLPTPETVKKVRKPREVKVAPVEEASEEPFSWEPAVLMKSEERLPYTMGIELTMMPPCMSGNERHRDRDQRIASGYASVVSQLLIMGSVGHQRCHQDQYAVEVSSDIMRTWGDVKAFYAKTAKAMTSAGLLPHVKEVISGGGHIHLGGIKPVLLANVLRDLQNRPYLNWIFNDPDDKNSSHSYATDLEDLDPKLVEAAKGCNYDPSLFGRIQDQGKAALLFFGNTKYVSKEWFPDDKSKMVRHCGRYDTLELRFFQSPLDWTEQESQIRFAFAYLKSIEEKVKIHGDIQVKYRTIKQVQAITIVEAKEEFYELVQSLGLPAKAYHRFVEENLEDRYKRGVRK
jgi:hypothetical protein